HLLLLPQLGLRGIIPDVEDQGRLAAVRDFGAPGVRSGSKAAETIAAGSAADVRFAPIATEVPRRDDPPLGAKSDQSASQQEAAYSITSSARASSVGGTLRPSAWAAVKLMTRSNLVGCSTGMSPGFAPRRILSTMPAARLHMCAQFGP